MTQQLEVLCKEISGLKLKPVDKTLPVDEEKVNWYKRRFDMLCEDGVPQAMNYYLEKLLTEDVNEHTLALIMYDATSRLRGDQ